MKKCADLTGQNQLPEKYNERQNHFTIQNICRGLIHQTHKEGKISMIQQIIS